MKKTILSKCPVCSEKLTITELTCNKCDTKIRGSFELDRFSMLDKEQLYFAEIFIKNRGNIKEIEKEMGISYPTVRKMLDDVISALGYKTVPVDKQSAKIEIIERLENGEISSDEAIKLMNQI